MVLYLRHFFGIIVNHKTKTSFGGLHIEMPSVAVGFLIDSILAHAFVKKKTTLTPVNVVLKKSKITSQKALARTSASM